MPRVGEEYVDAVERAVLQHIFDNFYGIVPHHADVFQMVFVDEFEQVAYAGTRVRRWRESRFRAGGGRFLRLPFPYRSLFRGF